MRQLTSLKAWLGGGSSLGEPGWTVCPLPVGRGRGRGLSRARTERGHGVLMGKWHQQRTAQKFNSSNSLLQSEGTGHGRGPEKWRQPTYRPPPAPSGRHARDPARRSSASGGGEISPGTQGRRTNEQPALPFQPAAFFPPSGLSWESWGLPQWGGESRGEE